MTTASSRRRPLRRSAAPRLRLVRQLELGDCGAACLAMTLAQLGRPVELSRLRDLTSTGRDGVSALGLVAAARQCGVDAVGARVPAERLGELAPGTILHWSGNHFVVLEGRSKQGYAVLDPARGRRMVTPDVVATHYSGVALIFTPPKGPAPAGAGADGPTPVRRRPVRARLTTYRPFAVGTARTAVLALLCAVAVQAFVLANPWVLRRVVGELDGARAAGSTAGLALGVLALAAGFFAAAAARLALLVTLQRRVDFRLTLGVLEHLVAQPYAFLARRSTGDLMLRLRSTVIVRQVLTSGALSTLLDGALVVGYLVVIAAVDLWFGVLTAAAVALQAAIVVLTWPALQRSSAEVLEAQTTSQGELVELVTGLELLKATGTADQVATRWSARLRTEVDAQASRSRLGGLVDSGLLAIRFAAPPLLLVLGLARVTSGALGLSDMLALAALSAAVTVPTGNLLSTVCSLSVVGSYLARLDDLLEAPVERRGPRVVDRRLDGRVRLEDVTYSYSTLLPPALHDVCLDIAAGEQVAVVGASGSGKSTLAMVVATLYEPTQGAVLIDGVDSWEYDVVSLRRRIGVVPQNPALFALTVRENIALGRPEATDAEVVEAARMAQIHTEIDALPSGYATQLGNAGAGLSGGQRQRIAIARAVVGRPGLLVLDEATSALDAATEAAVHRGLDALSCSRLVVAHRLTTIERADRVLVLDAGRVVADGTFRELRRTSAALRALLSAPPSRSGRLSP